MGIEKYQQHIASQRGADEAAQNRGAPIHEISDNHGEQFSLRFLEDVPLQVQVALGRVTLSIQKILALKEGSVIQLEREPDSTCDVLINGNQVARGEVVVVNDHYGIRITSVKDPHFFTESDGEGS